LSAGGNFFSLLRIFFLLIFAQALTFAAENVRPPFRAGQWYERGEKALRRQMSNLFSEAKNVKVKGQPIALIAPHAGFVFSGKSAAAAYRLLKRRNIKRVIIIGTNHTGILSRSPVLPKYPAFATPLGEVPVDSKICEELASHAPFLRDDRAHATEHSIESQLPFLQTVLGDFSIVPIVVGRLSNEDRKKCASALKQFLDETTIIVVSSDFTHYGASYGYVPFEEDIPFNIRKLDFGAIDRIKALDGSGFIDYCDSTGATICGREAIAILLECLPKDSRAILLDYYTSGDLTGDHNTSVSYAAIAFLKAGTEVSTNPGEESHLNPEEKAMLIRIARDSLRRAVTKHEILRLDENYELTPRLCRPGCAFVTLKEKGHLRGCIGELYPVRPLCESVCRNAALAALADRRFEPVREDEIENLSIEISVLGPLRRLRQTSEIEIGRDGLLIQKGVHRGVLLPQVPVEFGWDREEFLERTCRKAGLPPDAWKEGAKIYSFRAEVFGDEDVGKR